MKMRISDDNFRATIRPIKMFSCQYLAFWKVLLKASGRLSLGRCLITGVKIITGSNKDII